MNLEIPVDAHWGVGPIVGVDEHGPVTTFNPPGEKGMTFAACLDCGYVAPDPKDFFGVDCDRAANQINQTWREKVDDDGFPDPPEEGDE